ncbi:MAG TPA: hypothetical protein VEF33_13370 [Syntrophales bacterium]|nr:hypothetical protein [Syntrophales bacterium]
MDSVLKRSHKALILKLQYAEAHYQLAIIFKKKGLIEESNRHYNEAVRIMQTLKNRK